MFSVLDRIKSIFFPSLPTKRKSSDTSDILSDLAPTLSNEQSAKHIKQNNFSHLSVYADIYRKPVVDTFSDSKIDGKENIIGKRVKVQNDDINYKSSTGSLNTGKNLLGAINISNQKDNNNIQKSLSLDTITESNSEISLFSSKPKSHLLDPNFISNLIRPSIHDNTRQRRLILLQKESSVNKLEIKKHEDFFIEDIADSFRELCRIPAIIFPRFFRKRVLPDITDDMKDFIQRCAFIESRETILIEAFNLSITVTDIFSLQPRQWLTDNVINFYLELIYERNNCSSDKPKVQILTTFFYTKLESHGYSSVKRWSRRRFLFDSQLILIPIHLGNHWCLVTVDRDSQEVIYYDSLKSPNPRCLELIKEFLEEDSMDKLKQPLNTALWSFKQKYDGPSQLNGYDCGVFLCQTAEYIARKAKLDFTQDNMAYFRDKMGYEILTKKLL